MTSKKDKPDSPAYQNKGMETRIVKCYRLVEVVDIVTDEFDQLSTERVEFNIAEFGSRKELAEWTLEVARKIEQMKRDREL